MNKFMKVTSLGALLVAFAPVALATPISLTDGTTNGTVGTIASSSATDLGTLVVTTGLLHKTATGPGKAPLFTADYTESIYEGGDNALCPTCLAFVYQFDNSGQASSDILNMSTGNFTNFDTDAAYVVGTGTHAPNNDSRSDGIINFEFSPIGADSTNTDLLVLFTNATAYDTNGSFTLQDGHTIGVAAYQPTGTPKPHAGPSPVPEPGSLALLGTGLLTVVGFSRRKIKG